MSSKRRDQKPTIIIRKMEVVEGGHHGGAWKVAYADFVTAMMAFFLLMWLLNATTQEQRSGLADYFSPNSLAQRSTSGFGAPFGGRTPNVEGSLVSDRGAVQATMGPQHPAMDQDDDQGDVPAPPLKSEQPGMSPQQMAREGGIAPAAKPAPSAATDQELQAELARRERQEFERAAQQIRDAVRADPGMADLARQLTVDITPEGLRIQLLDEDRSPMFSTGSASINDRARVLLAKVAPVLLRLSQSIAIAGHTDAAPYRGGERSNWDLSAERANATRRLLAEAGLPESRIRSVTGHADRDPLTPGDRLAAANRRIAIVVLRDQPAGAR